MRPRMWTESIVPMYYCFGTNKKAIRNFANIFNTSDQPVDKNTPSCIYADYLCIATQDAPFKNNESTMREAAHSKHNIPGR